MTKLSLRVGVLVLGVTAAWAADTVRPATSSKGTSSTAQRSPTGRPTSGRGLLPDPALLDGSTQPAEKKSEYGMIGDFELPGDENAKNGRVGGGGGGPQGQNQPQQGQQQGGGGGGLPMGLPTAGGGGAQAQGGQPPGMPPGAQTAQQGGGSENPNAKENQPGGGAGDPNAKAEGIKVAQLGGDPSGPQTPGGTSDKPPPVAIGDSAMRIQTSANMPGVVGQQQIANQNTQVYEKGTGSGGKPPTGQQGPNRVEKGRAIPAGL